MNIIFHVFLQLFHKTYVLIEFRNVLNDLLIFKSLHAG